MDVVKDVDIFVFIDFFWWNLFGDDFVEDVVGVVCVYGLGIWLVGYGLIGIYVYYVFDNVVEELDGDYYLGDYFG